MKVVVFLAALLYIEAVYGQSRRGFFYDRDPLYSPDEDPMLSDSQGSDSSVINSADEGDSMPMSNEGTPSPAPTLKPTSEPLLSDSDSLDVDSDDDSFSSIDDNVDDDNLSDEDNSMPFSNDDDNDFSNGDSMPLSNEDDADSSDDDDSMMSSQDNDDLSNGDNSMMSNQDDDDLSYGDNSMMSNEDVNLSDGDDNNAPTTEPYPSSSSEEQTTEPAPEPSYEPPSPERRSDDKKVKCGSTVVNGMMKILNIFPKNDVVSDLNGYDSKIYEPFMREFISTASRDPAAISKANKTFLKQFLSIVINNRLNCAGTKLNSVFRSVLRSMVEEYLKKRLPHQLRSQLQTDQIICIKNIFQNVIQEYLDYIEVEGFQSAGCFVTKIQYLINLKEATPTYVELRSKVARLAGLYPMAFQCASPSVIYIDSFLRFRSYLGQISSRGKLVNTWKELRNALRGRHDLMMALFKTFYETFKPSTGITSKEKLVGFIARYISQQQLRIASSIIKKSSLFSGNSTPPTRREVQDTLKEALRLLRNLDRESGETHFENQIESRVENAVIRGEEGEAH